MNSSGQLSLHLLIYLEEELKTFSVKLTSEVLSTIDSDKFDFNTLEYVDMTKKIKKGISKSKGPSLLTYLFNNTIELPPDILKFVGVQR